MVCHILQLINNGKVIVLFKVDKLVTSLLRKCPLNVLVHLLESSSLSTPIQNRSQHFKL